MAKISETSAAFRIKTLSGGKIITMECPGYESEVFIPQIINSRLTLINAIEDRRCCKQNLNSCSGILQSTNENDERLPKRSIERVRPLANSTPAKTYHSSKENLSPVQSFPTPDIVRRAVVQNKNSSVQGLAPGIKVVRLHRAHTPNTPNKVAKIVSSSKTQRTLVKSQALRNLKNLSMFRTPPRLSISNNTPVNNSPSLRNRNDSIPVLPPGISVVRLHRAPNPNTPSKFARIHRSRIQSPQTISACARQTQILRNLSTVSMLRTPPAFSTTNKSPVSQSPNHSFLLRKISVPGSATKWRKCITPQRTYMRSSLGQKKKTSLKVEHVKPMPLGKNGKALPDFQVNPTKYPSGKGSVVFRRRKLIIDKKLTIDPNEFKQQLKYTGDLKRASNFKLPKSRRQYIALQQTAFDLLTNSCYHPRASKQLNELFREGCLHKRADTILKYRQLIEDIPQLETL